VFNSDFDGHYITVRLGSESLDALIDTGAVRSLINEQTARDLKLHVVPKTNWNSKPLLSANGSELETIGHVMAELYLKGLKVEQCLEVSRSLSLPLILGFDFLRMNQACINYALRPSMFTLFDGLIQLPFIPVVMKITVLLWRILCAFLRIMKPMYRLKRQSDLITRKCC